MSDGAAGDGTAPEGGGPVADGGGPAPSPGPPPVDAGGERYAAPSLDEISGMSFAEQQAVEEDHPGLIRELIGQAWSTGDPSGAATAAVSTSPQSSDPDAWVVELAAKVDPFLEPGAREAFNAAMDEAEKTGDSFRADEAIADYTRALFIAHGDYQRSLEGTQQPGGQVVPGQEPGSGREVAFEHDGDAYSQEDLGRILTVVRGLGMQDQGLFEAEFPGLITAALCAEMEQQPDRMRDQEEARREEARGRDALQKQWRTELRARKRGHH